MILNDLDEDCFLLVLERCRLPLAELLRLRIISRKWHSAVNRMCSWVTSLKLFGSTEDVAFYCRDLLRWNLQSNQELCLKSIGDDLLVKSRSYNDQTEMTEFITTFFPNVNSLVIGFYLGPCPFVISELLFSWPKLKTFALASIETISYPNFWYRLNSMSRLKSLFFFELFSMSIPVRMPIFSRVESLLVKRTSARDLLPVMRNLQTSRLMINFGTCTADQFQRWITANPRLSSTLTHLTIGGLGEAAQQDQRSIFSLICSAFPEMSYLDIWYFKGLRLTDIVPELAPLTNITELHLRLGINLHNLGMDFNLDQDGNGDQGLPLELLDTVKVLHLNDYTNNSQMDEYFEALLSLIFPSVESLLVRTGTHLLREYLRMNGNELFPQLRKLDLYETVGDRISHDLAGRYDSAKLVHHLATLREISSIDDEYIDPNNALLL